MKYLHFYAPVLTEGNNVALLKPHSEVRSREYVCDSHRPTKGSDQINAIRGGHPEAAMSIWTQTFLSYL